MILEEQEIEFRSLGSTTFKNPVMAQGIEPDQRFYIQNEAKIPGKSRTKVMKSFRQWLRNQA